MQTTDKKLKLVQYVKSAQNFLDNYCKKMNDGRGNIV